ncbi:MAG: hypothetical protein VST70_05965 [Nitrospirota bacterium]|nr:hypothetical protein [Nitrospirota bacterium]
MDPLSRMVIAPYPFRYRKTLAFSDIPDAGSSSLSLAAPESANLISRAGFPMGRSIPHPLMESLNKQDRCKRSCYRLGNLMIPPFGRQEESG